MRGPSTGLSNVRERGVEPLHPFGHWHLKPARLPIPPLAREPHSTCGRTSTQNGQIAMQMTIIAQVTWDYTNTDGITMGLLDNVEKRLDRIVNGSFSKAFKAQIEPVEIAAALQHEIDMRAKNQDGRVIAPNRFAIGLSEEDYNRMAGYFAGLQVELAKVITDHCVKQRYAAVDQPELWFTLNADLRVGDVSISSESAPRQNLGTPASSALAGETLIPAAVTAPEATPHLRATDGKDFPLNQSVIKIGRGKEADIQITDAGISRIHCSIVLGSQVIIKDNGSTNGTLVDGKKITEAPLNHGSMIQIGSSTFTYLSR